MPQPSFSSVVETALLEPSALLRAAAEAQQSSVLGHRSGVSCAFVLWRIELLYLFMFLLLCSALAFGSSLRRGQGMKIFETLYMTFFILKFHEEVLWQALFSSLSVRKTGGFQSGDSFLQFWEIVLNPFFIFSLPCVLLPGTREQMLGLLDRSSRLIFSLFFLSHLLALLCAGWTPLYLPDLRLSFSLLYHVSKVLFLFSD